MSVFNSDGLDNDGTGGRDRAVVADSIVSPPAIRKSLFGQYLVEQPVFDLPYQYNPRRNIQLTFASQAAIDIIDSVTGREDSNSWGRLPKSIDRVLFMSPLPMCAKKNISMACDCTELTHWVSPTYQDDIRKTYALVVQWSNCRMGNEFLKSFMLRRQFSCGWHWRYYIPCFLAEKRIRLFIVCPQTFMNLFGISKRTFYRLRSQKDKQYDHFQQTAPFQFIRIDNEEYYCLGGDYYFHVSEVQDRVDFVVYKSETKND